MNKRAAVDHAIGRELEIRYSPRAFSERPIPSAVLRQLFEAARWAPSCFNEQPWRFVVAERNDAEAFNRILSCMAEKNQTWAKDAQVVMVSIAASTFARNDKPNRHAFHDVGLAMFALTVEAARHGIGVHQMAGFDPEKARAELAIPDGFEAVAAVALGVPGDPDTLPEDFAEKERAPRTRRPQSDFVFAGQFGAPLSPPEEELARDVLHFWFGDLGPDDVASDGTRERWFSKSQAFDAEVRDRFGNLHALAMGGGCDTWSTSVQGRVALILILDQFSRNMFRGTPSMFQGDDRALELSLDAIDIGLDANMHPEHRAFAYMPLLHSEDIDVQEYGIAAIESWRASLPADRRQPADSLLHFAKLHRDIVERFGRFPHRNVLLQRQSTPEEHAFLQTEGSSF